MKSVDPVVQFGKHKGQRLSQLDAEYIERIIELNKQTIAQFERELERRKQIEEANVPMTTKLVSAGYRALAKQLHPDVGGDAASFNELQAAKSLLDEAVRRLT